MIMTEKGILCMENKFLEWLLKAVTAFVIFIGFHYVMSTFIRKEPFAFDWFLDVAAPLLYVGMHTMIENRKKN